MSRIACWRTDVRWLASLALAWTTLADAQVEPGDPCRPGVVVSIVNLAYATIEEAAIMAVGSALRFGIQPEVGGFIVKDGEIYRFSRSQTSGEHNAVRYCTVVPPGMQYIGRYHTHQPGELGFSALDKKGANEDQVVSFVGVMRENVILAYDPANGQTHILGTMEMLGAERSSGRFEPRVTAANAIAIKVLEKFVSDPAYFGPGARVRIQRAIDSGKIPEEVAELMKIPEFSALAESL
jgi:hypothetical protein